jgi:DNA-directed RNA polymerase specialized sigma24 family protein
MDPAEALARLPRPYAVALRLRAGGAADALIAGRLGVEPEAVEPLLRIARAKLAAALEHPGDEHRDEG